jgi:fermentation-respiration switch protein FrsA (DUF1100 family)
MISAAEGEVEFIVSLAGPGVDGRTLLYLQRSALLKVSGAPDTFIDDYNKTMNEITDAVLAADSDEAAREAAAAILAGTPLESATETVLAQLSSQEMRSFVLFDPAAYYQKIHVPVLALNGEKDLQVPAGPNLKAIRDGLSHNRDVTTIAYPELNHLFQTAETGRIEEYGEIEETIAPQVLEDIAAWILKITK